MKKYEKVKHKTHYKWQLPKMAAMKEDHLKIMKKKIRFLTYTLNKALYNVKYSLLHSFIYS